jgi:hypothetical protein
MIITNARMVAVWKKTGENTYEFSHYRKLEGDITIIGGESQANNEAIIEEEDIDARVSHQNQHSVHR